MNNNDYSSLVYQGLVNKDKSKNNKSIDFTLQQLVLNLAIMAYEYENMPKEIPIDLVEKNLFYTGQSVFFEVGGHYMCTQAVANGDTLNVYGVPTQYKPYGVNGAQFDNVYVDDYVFMNDKELVTYDKNAVLLWNFVDGRSTYSIIEPILSRLNYIWQSIGITEALSRAKLLFITSQNSKKSAEAEMKRLFDGISPVISITDKSLTDSFTNIETGNNANDIQPLWNDFDKTFGLLLTCFGFNSNSEPSKKARLNIAEVESNNEIVRTMREAGLFYRQKAVDEINELFGLDIKVKMRNDDDDEDVEYIVEDDITDNDEGDE